MLKYCKIHMFADDMFLYLSGTNIAELSTITIVELEGVNEWLSNNSSSVNVEKTNVWELVNLVL